MTIKKYVMLIDTERCINCKACEVACRAEWHTPAGYSRNWVSEVEHVDEHGVPRLSFLSGRCQHCDEPACVDACPTGAAYKRDDGIVLVDHDTCTGCEFCTDVCPYDARFRDPVNGMISKCTFCQPRVDAGEEPACVSVCWTRALTFGDINDPYSEVSKKLAKGGWKQMITPEVNVGPNLYYSENTRFDETVLPRIKQPTLAARALDDVVNPGMKIGIGGMIGLFGAAGILKLISRKQEVANNE